MGLLPEVDDSLWIKTNKGMTRALASELKTFIDAYDNEKTDKDFIIVLYKENLDINIKYKENLKLPIHNDKRWFSPIDRTLRRELKSRNLNYWFDTTSYKQLVIFINIPLLFSFTIQIRVASPFRFFNNVVGKFTLFFIDPFSKKSIIVSAAIDAEFSSASSVLAPK